METILDLYRHAITPMNIEEKVQGGDSNPPLVRPDGVNQCLALGRLLDQMGDSLKYDEIYDAGLLRTSETIKYIGLKGNIIIAENLKECRWGEFAGQPYQAPHIQRAFARLLIDSDFAPPGGESHRQVRERVWKFALPILKSAKGKRIAFISSIGAVRAFLCQYFGLSHQDGFSIGVPNGGIYRVYLNRVKKIGEALEYLDPSIGQWRPGLCPVDSRSPISKSATPQ